MNTQCFFLYLSVFSSTKKTHAKFYFLSSTSNTGLEELSFIESGIAISDVKQEPMTDVPDLSFEQIMVNDNADEFNFAQEDSSSNSLFQESSSQNHISDAPNPSILTMNGNQSDSNNPTIEQLQIDLLKRQIEVQELMATELRVKIERTRQLMKMEMAESELRRKEISNRLES